MLLCSKALKHIGYLHTNMLQSVHKFLFDRLSRMTVSGNTGSVLLRVKEVTLAHEQYLQYVFINWKSVWQVLLYDFAEECFYN